MKDIKNDALARLFRSAALAKPDTAAAEVSFPLQARILAAWRAGRDETEAFLPLLRKAILAAAVVSSLIFGFGHLYQGWSGMLKTGAVGAFLAGTYLLSGSLFVGMLIHALMDMYSGRLLHMAWSREVAPPAEPAA